jgi:flagellin
MRINTNVSSLVAQESATNTGKAIASSLEKLSSGLRINKASDDSSGLAIADKLRTQATSIGQGISNGNSAVALLQIADKSMGEQSNILDTIKSKLVQANTDTTSDAGRESIRKDVSKLLTQLDNIAAQTNYNGKSLLADVKDGKLTGKEASALNFQIGANNTNIISTASINSTTASLGGGSNTKISEIKENSTTTLKNVTGGTLSLEAATGANLDINVSGNLGKVSGVKRSAKLGS